MDRKERLTFCEKCKNRAFLPDKGIVCSLTSEHASFEGSCPDFLVDQPAADRMLLRQEERRYQEELENPTGSSILGINNKIIGGIIGILVAIVWFFGALIYLDRIFFYPPVLLIISIVALFNGINAQKKKQREQDTILDADLDI